MKFKLALMALLLSGCGSEQVDLHFDCPSADGSMIATIYYVTKGPRPIDREIHMNLHRSDDAFDASMSSFAIRYGYDAVVRWDSPSSISLDYPADSTVMRMEHVVFGSSQTFEPERQIRVNYRELPSTHGYFVTEKRCFN